MAQAQARTGGVLNAPTRPASLALALGVIAMVAIPLSFTLAQGLGVNPSGSVPIATVVEFGGLIAALGAFMFGRSARRAGDRSNEAIWGPRLGAAALLGFLLLRFGAATPVG